MTGKISRIPCVIMRGGTSRGPYFKAADLPADTAERDRVLLAVMGSPHPMQVDGIGGSYTQTSKVAIVSPSARDDIDVDFLFAQVSVDEAIVGRAKIFDPKSGRHVASVHQHDRTGIAEIQR